MEWLKPRSWVHNDHSNTSSSSIRHPHVIFTVITMNPLCILSPFSKVHLSLYRVALDGYPCLIYPHMCLYFFTMDSKLTPDLNPPWTLTTTSPRHPNFIFSFCLLISSFFQSQVSGTERRVREMGVGLSSYNRTSKVRDLFSPPPHPHPSPPTPIPTP